MYANNPVLLFKFKLDTYDIKFSRINSLDFRGVPCATSSAILSRVFQLRSLAFLSKKAYINL